MVRNLTPLEAFLVAALIDAPLALRPVAQILVALLQCPGRAAISAKAAVRQWKYFRNRRRRASQAGAAACRHPIPRRGTSLQMQM